MPNKKPLFLSLFFSLLIFSSMVLVKAPLSYYNWVSNGDFAQYTQIAEDGGFESGSFNSGILYGNFSGTEAEVTVSNVFPYAGVYSVSCQYGSGVLRYNFTSNEILGADVQEFSAYCWMATGLDVEFTVHYSDLTSDSDTYSGSGNVWTKINILGLDFIDPLRYVVAFDIDEDAIRALYIDEVIFRGGGFTGQTTIDYYSHPWYCSGSIPLDIGLDTAVGHYSIGSGYIGGTDFGGELIQDIDYADTDYVHYIDLWAYSTVGNNIRLQIVYSDGTSDQDYEAIVTFGSWVHYIFSGFLDSGKYITEIQIGLLNPFTGRINFDDVGLWSSVQKTPETTRFSFIISPTPISVAGTQVILYLTVNYQFFGYIRNATGGLSENGTFTAIHATGSTTGVIALGQFNFPIPYRSTLVQAYESIGIIANLGTVIEEFGIIIEWKRYAGQEPTQPEEDIPWISTPSGINFIVMLVMVFVPSMILGAKFSEYRQGLLGFIIGLGIMSSIAYLTGLMPLWFLFVCILAFVILIIYGLKGGGF